MKRPKPVSLETLELRCFKWNTLHPIGSPVEYHPVICEPAHHVTRTRSEAYVLGGYTAVLFVDGVSGCVALDACVPIAKEAVPQ